MKKQSYSFPSVYEATGTNLSFVSRDLINGLQLYDQHDQSYIIGNLALNEGVSPNKLVNSSPYELDYQLLLQAGLLLANHNNQRPLAITTGFPFSTFQIYKDIAKQTILNLNSIEYNPGTFKNEERIHLETNIQQVEILPEMIGNIIGLRVGQAQASGNFFVVSLGYGTCEAVLSTENGIVHRTASSINGMQYAVDLFMRSLGTKYYLGLKTEKQLDVSFRNDHIILDRQKVNIVDLRRRILERYYIDIISNGLRKSFTDSDFERADKIYLTGGGALFPELIEMFEKEFKQIAKVEVVKNPLTLTSEGYNLNSIMLTDGDESTAIGLDIGNANTVLTQYVNDNVDNEIAEKIVVRHTEEKKNEISKNKAKKEIENEEIAAKTVEKQVEILPEAEVAIEQKVVEEVIVEQKIETEKTVQVDKVADEPIIEEITVNQLNPEDEEEDELVMNKEIAEVLKKELISSKKEIVVEQTNTSLIENEAVSIEKIQKRDVVDKNITVEKNIVEEIEEKEILKVVDTIKEEDLDEDTEIKSVSSVNHEDYEPDFS